MEVRPAWPAELLRARRLTVISDAPGPEPEPELAALAARVPAAVRCDGRDDLERGLGALLAAVPAAPVVAAKTLDLYGHATGDDGLLRLGGWLIDGRSPRVTAFFRGLAEHDVLPRLGVYAVRLLACRTADTHAGRATICALADVLGLEVYGTPNLIHAAHVDADGFAPCWEHLLVGSCDLRRTTPERELEPAGVPWPDRRAHV